MKVTITIDGMSRDYQGTYEELHVRDWDKRMQDFLDDVSDYAKVETVMPPDMFGDTMDALDKLTIRK